MVAIEDMNKPAVKDSFLNDLPANMHLFEGCGNMLGVVPLTLAGYTGDKDEWKQIPELRDMLTKWGREIKSDSVMVLTGDPRKLDEQEGYHVRMAVFEPNGDDGSGLGGGVSTMCGNGVRAVAAWVREFYPDLDEALIETGSGLRKIKIEGDQYLVDMGEMVNSASDLADYVNSESAKPNEEGEYLDAEIPEEILRELGKFTPAKTWSIGLTGTRNEAGNIDGEPHTVIEVPREQVANIDELRELAVAAGPIITKNLDIFPQEMNINFIVRDGIDEEGRFVIWNCTHERNLGDDADHSVTAACGTGSTVSGGVMFEKYVSDKTQTVLVKNTGGDLEISLHENPGTLIMKGPASRV